MSAPEPLCGDRTCENFGCTQAARDAYLLSQDELVNRIVGELIAQGCKAIRERKGEEPLICHLGSYHLEMDNTWHLDRRHGIAWLNVEQR